MLVKAIKTDVFQPKADLFLFLHRFLPKIEERSVVVVTSKLLSYAQDRFAEGDKHELVKQEADKWLDPHSSQYNLMLTIKDNILAVNAGVDDSNSIEGKHILWPENTQMVADDIWAWLRCTYMVKEVGVIITDSKTMPLKWGVTGTCMAHSGFRALRDYRGEKDIFGRILKMSQSNVSEALAIAAVLEMGEADEQKPIAVITDIADILFQHRMPTEEELDDLTIDFEDDAYYPILKEADWH